MLLRCLEISVEHLFVRLYLDVVLGAVGGVGDEEKGVGGREGLCAAVHDGAGEVGDGDLGVGHEAVAGDFHGSVVGLHARGGNLGAVAPA